MKNKSLCFFLAVFCLSFMRIENVRSQTAFALQDSLDLEFSQLNTSKLNTGLLIDKTIRFANTEKFDGVYDTTATWDSFEKIYFNLKNASFNHSQFATLDSFENKRASFTNKGLIPISILKYKYNSISPSAYAKKWVVYDSVKDIFKDMSKNRQNIFNTNTAFSAASGTIHTDEKDLKFVFDKSMIFTDDPNAISSIQVDFGNGYLPVTFGTPIAMNYSSVGIKTISIRVKYINGIVYHAKTSINVTIVKPLRAAGIAVQTWYATQSDFILNGDPNNIPNGYAMVSVRFGKDQNTGNQKICLTKPVIFVEGIDFDRVDHHLKNGASGFMDLQTGKNPDLPILIYAPKMLDQFYNAGYDIVFVDFWDGADAIEAEAAVLQNIIINVNSNKCSSEENVVIGASMGGQVSRYALASMEKNNIKHCTREYVSFDSPQQYANIPLGVQWFLDYFKSGGPPAVQAALDNQLNRPATREMLILHYQGGYHNTLRDSWVNKRNAIGYPQKTRNTAIINGGDTGSDNTSSFNAGDQLIDFDNTVALFVHVVGNVWSVPGTTGFPQCGNPYRTIFHGKRPNHSTSTPCLDATTKHYDNCAGSYTDDIKALGGATSNGFYIQVLHPITSFIPSISALDRY